MRGLPTTYFPCLDSCDVEFLDKIIMDKEIKKEMFDMVHLKALGSNGFHTLFFQKHKRVVGGMICAWVNNIFGGKVIDPELNTLAVLIPKVLNP